MTDEGSGPITGHGKSSKDGNLDPEIEMSEGTLELSEIDLGDDLIETTTIVGDSEESPDAVPRSAIDPGQVSALQRSTSEAIQNARILMSEGLTEDAKAVLRRALIRSPNDGRVLKLMLEIQEGELQRLMRVNEEVPRKAALPEEVPDIAQVISALDADFKLGILESTSLFREELVRPESVDACIEGATAQDLIDLGIGFMEFSLYDLAIRLFSAALKPETSLAEVRARSACALLAEAQIAASRPFEAIASIQPVLRDSEIASADKIQFFYLMGRAFEVIGKKDLARQWFGQVAAHDADYRDVQDRLTR